MIAQRDRQDLVLLEQVVETMQAASKVATAIEKLKVASERFCLIAQSYLSQQESQPAIGANVGVGAQGQFANIDNTAGANQNLDINMPEGALPAGAGAFESLPDFPWDGMLSEWDLGLGAEKCEGYGSFLWSVHQHRQRLSTRQPDQPWFRLQLGGHLSVSAL